MHITCIEYSTIYSQKKKKRERENFRLKYEHMTLLMMLTPCKKIIGLVPNIDADAFLNE